MLAAAAVFDPYAEGILKEEIHAQLVKHLDNFARDAAIRREWICKPLAKSVSPAEVEWVKKFPRHAEQGCSGLVLTGPKASRVADRMSAIAGALVRNFIRARVFTLQQILDAFTDGGPPDPT